MSVPFHFSTTRGSSIPSFVSLFKSSVGTGCSLGKELMSPLLHDISLKAWHLPLGQFPTWNSNSGPKSILKAFLAPCRKLAMRIDVLVTLMSPSLVLGKHCTPEVSYSPVTTHQQWAKFNLYSLSVEITPTWAAVLLGKHREGILHWLQGEQHRLQTVPLGTHHKLRGHGRAGTKSLTGTWRTVCVGGGRGGSRGRCQADALC